MAPAKGRQRAPRPSAPGLHCSCRCSVATCLFSSTDVSGARGCPGGCCRYTALLRSTRRGHASRGPRASRASGRAAHLMLARASLTSSGRWAFFDPWAYNRGASSCVTAMGRGGAASGGWEGVWRVEPGEGPAPPRNLPHCPESLALTLLGTALPGHILTFLQGPLARSVLSGGCG